MPEACYTCNSTNLFLWDNCNGIEVWVCEDCGHGWAPMDAEARPDFEEKYDADYYDTMAYDEKWSFRLGRAERWLAYVGELHPPPGKFLDIGCSLGYFLEAAERLGWQPYGTDMSQYAVKECNDRGLRVFRSAHPDEFPDSLPKIDLAAATHLLEHLDDPIDYLTRLRQYMAPEAMIYIQVPNFTKRFRRGPDAGYIGPPMHTHFFTLDTIKACLDQAGWDYVDYPAIRPHYIGINPWRWIKEILYEAPRELIREPFTRNGMLSNIHVFARAQN